MIRLWKKRTARARSLRALVSTASSALRHQCVMRWRTAIAPALAVVRLLPRFARWRSHFTGRLVLRLWAQTARDSARGRQLQPQLRQFTDKARQRRAWIAWISAQQQQRRDKAYLLRFRHIEPDARARSVLSRWSGYVREVQGAVQRIKHAVLLLCWSRCVWTLLHF